MKIKSCIPYSRISGRMESQVSELILPFIINVKFYYFFSKDRGTIIELITAFREGGGFGADMQGPYQYNKNGFHFKSHI